VTGGVRLRFGRLGLEVEVRNLGCAVVFAGERAHQNFAARRVDAREKIPDDGNMLRHVVRGSQS